MQLDQDPFEAPSIRRITVLQGQSRVSASAQDELTTILGSCVATCLFDPVAGVGGMNHFLLPEPPRSHDPGEVDVHYGVYLMEILINEMIKCGARKDRMRAHLYGGANLRPGMVQIGTANATFARNFLVNENIPLLREALGGKEGRRVEFRPASGKVRCRMLDGQPAPAETVPARQTILHDGDVELF